MQLGKCVSKTISVNLLLQVVGTLDRICRNRTAHSAFQGRGQKTRFQKCVLNCGWLGVKSPKLFFSVQSPKKRFLSDPFPFDRYSQITKYSHSFEQKENCRRRAPEPFSVKPPSKVFSLTSLKKFQLNIPQKFSV